MSLFCDLVLVEVAGSSILVAMVSIRGEALRMSPNISVGYYPK